MNRVQRGGGGSGSGGSHGLGAMEVKSKVGGVREAEWELDRLPRVWLQGLGEGGKSVPPPQKKKSDFFKIVVKGGKTTLLRETAVLFRGEEGFRSIKDWFLLPLCSRG